MRRQISAILLTLVAIALSIVSVTIPAAAQNNSSIERISVASDGTQGNDYSYSPRRSLGMPTISSDGRYVVFNTASNNLVPEDTNNSQDVFVHDRQTGQTTRVSVASNGTQGDKPSVGGGISGDGRFVVFESASDNLVANDLNGQSDVFVHDMQTGQTIRVSIQSDGSEAQGISFDGSISADGRYVAFESDARNLGSITNYRNVYVHDMQTGLTTLASVNSRGEIAGYLQDAAVISANGRYVAFDSSSTNLVDNDTNGGYTDAFVHDMQTGQTTLVSVASDGTQRNAESSWPVLSADGRYVAFYSQASFTSEDTSVNTKVFVHDMQTGETKLVSIAADGTASDAGGEYPSISGDGRYITFESFSSNLVANDTSDTVYDDDIFVRDMQLNKTIRISVPVGITPNLMAASGIPSISSDGKIVTYESFGANQVANDTNNAMDIFAAPVSFSNLPTPTATATLTLSATSVPNHQVGTFKQTDDRWATDPYAWHPENGKPVSKWTIGGDKSSKKNDGGSGCFITSVVNIMYYWGITTDVNGQEVNPRNINNFLSQLGIPNGYNVNGGASWSGIAKYVSGKIQISLLPLPNGQTKTQVIDAQLALGQPVMVGVNNDGHWVVITGPKINGHYPISDPGYKLAANLGAYGDEAGIGSMKLVKPSSSYTPQQTVTAHSPVELMITDSIGRRTGYDPTSQTFVNEIPDTDYEVEEPLIDQTTGLLMGEPLKVLHIPQGTAGQYQLTVTGTGNGHYGLDFETLDTSGNVDIQTQEGIASVGSNMDYQYTYNSDTIALNQHLIANAGSDQTLFDNDKNGTEPVVLDGSGSTDSSGTIQSYLWLENGVTIATGINPTFNLAAGVHSITLIVKDSDGDQSSDVAQITVLTPGVGAPEQNYFTTDTPILTWTRISSAFSYEIQVSSRINFDNAPYFTAMLSADKLSVITTHLPNGNYYWRIRACSQSGCASWSATDSFTVNALD